MRPPFKRHFFCLLLLPLSFLSAQGRDVIGYYPSWACAERDGRLLPARLPFDQITILNYAFFLPKENGELVGKDAKADSLLLAGPVDAQTGRRDRSESLISKAHEQGVKVMISIGGWADSAVFPSVADDSVKTATFAGECVRCIRQYAFDGIDIDWEYPGYAPHNGSDRDRGNFTRFLQAIRDSLDARTKITGVYYPLSAALSASPRNASDMEMGKVGVLLDFVNLMTYDYHGSWDSRSNHNSPLYPTVAGEPQSCFESTFRLYHDVYRIPAEKINLGVPFYSHSYGRCEALYGPSQGSGRAVLPFGGDYYGLMKVLDRFEQRWDETAQAPYLIHREGKVVVSYDNPRSIALKAGFVKAHNARGLIIWEITGDMMDDGTSPLLESINRVFNEK